MKILLQDDVVLPQGFTAAGLAVGLKRSGKKDIMMVVSDRQAACAGVFTTNQVKAAPVKIDQEVVRRKTARATARARPVAGRLGDQKGRQQ